MFPNRLGNDAHLGKLLDWIDDGIFLDFVGKRERRDDERPWSPRTSSNAWSTVLAPPWTCLIVRMAE
jgi:hypothetical protein